MNSVSTVLVGMSSTELESVNSVEDTSVVEPIEVMKDSVVAEA